MTTHDFDFSVLVQPKRLRFDRYVLDLDRGCLQFDGNEIALRPKTFAVLKLVRMGAPVAPLGTFLRTIQHGTG